MSQSMHIVTLKETGHILAAFAETTSSGEPDLKAVVGRDLPIWKPRQEGDVETAVVSLVPVEVLELKSVPLDSAVIANPQKHAVDGGRVVELPPWGAPPGHALNETKVTLEDGTSNTKGLAIVAREGAPDVERRVQSGEFADPLVDLELPLAILPGESPASVTTGQDFDIMVALAGRRPVWVKAAL